MILVEVAQFIEHENWTVHGGKLYSKVTRLIESHLYIYLYTYIQLGSYQVDDNCIS